LIVKPLYMKKTPKCPKCKKALKDASALMMGLDKKCFDCHVTWTKRHHFKGFPKGNPNI